MSDRKVSLEFASRHLNKQERVDLDTFLHREDITKIERGKPYLETLLEVYPALKNEERTRTVYQKNLNGYNTLGYPATIQPRDICFSFDYGVEMPDEDFLKKIGAGIFKGPEDINLENFSLALKKIWKTFYHAEDKCSAGFPQPAFESPYYDFMRSKYLGKTVKLEDVISGKLPGVCFEKALLLAAVLSVDEEIKRSGVGVYLARGLHASDGQTPGGHAWVRLEIPQRFDKKVFPYNTYILDPTSNKIFIWDINYPVDNANHKYEEYYNETPYTRFNFRAYTIYRRTVQPPKQRSGIISRIRKYLGF